MDYTFYIIAVLLVVEGIMNSIGILLPLQGLGMKKYTDESVKAWCRPYGLSCIIVGIGLGCFNAYVFDDFKITALIVIGIIGLAIGIISSLVVMKKYLVVK